MVIVFEEHDGMLTGFASCDVVSKVASGDIPPDSRISQGDFDRLLDEVDRMRGSRDEGRCLPAIDRLIVRYEADGKVQIADPLFLLDARENVVKSIVRKVEPGWNFQRSSPETMIEVEVRTVLKGGALVPGQRAFFLVPWGQLEFRGVAFCRIPPQPVGQLSGQIGSPIEVGDRVIIAFDRHTEYDSTVRQVEPSLHDLFLVNNEIVKPMAYVPYVDAEDDFRVSELENYIRLRESQ